MSGPVSGRAIAPPDRRFHAWVIDRLVALVGFIAAAAAAYDLVRSGHTAAAVALLGVVLLGLWLVGVLLTGLAGTTVGKSLCGLRVLDEHTAEPLGLPRAAARQAIVGLGGYPTLGIGDAVLAWTATLDASGRRRSGHDRAVRSVVVDVRTLAADVSRTRPAELVNLTALRLTPVPLRAEAEAGTTAWRVTFDTGPSFVVDGVALVGRRPRSSDGARVIALPDASLSKTHAQLGLAPDGALVVMDRGSTNGSVLLRAGATRPLAARQPVTLVAGDRVRFGGSEMAVERV